MPVITNKYTDVVFAVTTFSQGHIAAIFAEIYTCEWKLSFYEPLPTPSVEKVTQPNRSTKQYNMLKTAK